MTVPWEWSLPLPLSNQCGTYKTVESGLDFRVKVLKPFLHCPLFDRKRLFDLLNGLAKAMQGSNSHNFGRFFGGGDFYPVYNHFKGGVESQIPPSY